MSARSYVLCMFMYILQKSGRIGILVQSPCQRKYRRCAGRRGGTGQPLRYPWARFQTQTLRMSSRKLMTPDPKWERADKKSPQKATCIVVLYFSSRHTGQPSPLIRENKEKPNKWEESSETKNKHVEGGGKVWKRVAKIRTEAVQIVKGSCM